MRKSFFTLIAASLILTAARAQSPCGVVAGLPEALRQASTVKMQGCSSVVMTGKTVSGRIFGTPSNGRMAVRGSQTLPVDVITDTPAGNQLEMYGHAHGYWLDEYQYLNEATPDGCIVHMVENGSEVYIKDPCSTLPTHSWLKGERHTAADPSLPDTVVFKLPQAMYKSEDKDGKDVYLYAQMIKLEYNDNALSVNLSDSQELRLVCKGDTLMKEGTDVFGLTSADNTWTAFGDDNMTFFPQTDVPTAVPGGAPAGVKYTLRHKVTRTQWDEKTVRVVRDGSDFYIGDMLDGADFWVKGTVSGNKIVFSRQYLGKTDADVYYYKYFSPLKVDTVYQGNVGVNATYTLRDNMKLDYNDADASFAAAYNMNMVINNGKMSFFSNDDNIYQAPQFTPAGNQGSGINSTASDAAPAVSVSYTDLAGRRIALPSAGIYLKTVRLSDGSVRTTKVVLK